VGRRILSTILLWSLIAAVMYFFRRTGVVVVLAVFTAAAQNELYLMLEKIGHRPFRHLGVTLGVLLIAVPYFVVEYVGRDELHGIDSALIAITMVAACLRVMRERTGGNRMETLIATIFGVVYLPYMLSFIVRVMWLDTSSEATNGAPAMMLVVWLLCTAKFCDVGALLVGSQIGRHKLAPSMSPAKTWEGAIGGVIVASGVCAGLVALFPRQFPAGFTPLKSALAAMLPATVSITSDLIESVLKRMAGCKDSGKTIPGIGGAFDLVDSLVLAAPVGYLILRVIL
jgi:phosphatidate cytidylyltransferase